MSFDNASRHEVVRLAAALYDRGLTPGRTGNISVRTDDAVMITPTNACLGRLDPDRLSVTSLEGEHRSGDKPSKELELHRAFYDRHPECRAVAHLHSTYAVAISCLEALDADQPLAPITPYFVMRVGTLPLVDYAPPGSADLAERVRAAAQGSRAALLRRHGTIAAAATLEGAVDAVEEIEETARLHLLLDGRAVTPLSGQDVAALEQRPGSAARTRR